MKSSKFPTEFAKEVNKVMSAVTHAPFRITHAKVPTMATQKEDSLQLEGIKKAIETAMFSAKQLLDDVPSVNEIIVEHEGVKITLKRTKPEKNEP